MPWPPNSPDRAWWGPGITMEQAEHLDVIEEMGEQLVRLEQMRHVAVTNARGEGASWARIGRALHMSKQAAQKRYDRRLF